MEDECGKVHGQQCVEVYDGWLRRFKGEHHIPDGGCVQCGEASAKAPWSPIGHRYLNNIRKLTESAEQKTPAASSEAS